MYQYLLYSLSYMLFYFIFTTALRVRNHYHPPHFGRGGNLSKLTQLIRTEPKVEPKESGSYLL